MVFEILTHVSLAQFSRPITCSSSANRDTILNSAINDGVFLLLISRFTIRREWKMVGYLDMTDPTKQCLASWQTITSPRSSHVWNQKQGALRLTECTHFWSQLQNGARKVPRLSDVPTPDRFQKLTDAIRWCFLMDHLLILDVGGGAFKGLLSRGGKWQLLIIVIHKGVRLKKKKE